ncbi:DUF2848 domain-containing protein [Brevibacillus fluminis]|uniref:DUF2848 domain-containing protein n=1 Tax=Brevibacillus fluminis TaxID=511487 RepID=A0A3M8DAM2_9BACL|nr:DUF2848 family protein [Brevibacillus fluminis]RNB84641.1 DUF2848 domain-containing protein [Brevibacillus fluminis]
MKIQCNGSMLEWEPTRLIIAGYTGKDQKVVQQHIDELKELGIPAPPRVPMIYDLSPQLMQVTDAITVVQNHSSGEAEAVLLDINGEWYVGLGSDHTDRVLEASSIQKSKQVCLKPISQQVWPLDAIRAYWDEIEMESWIIDSGVQHLYQRGTLGSFLDPDELFRILRERDYVSEGMAVFCGTLPLHSGTFQFGETFLATLRDPRTGSTIQLTYHIKQLKDAEEV